MHRYPASFGMSLQTMVSGLAFMAALMLPSAASAQGSWLQQGKDLFKSSAPSVQTPTTVDLSTSEIASGLKDALKVGSGRVVDQLGVTDGFNADPAIHIPLPEQLQTVRSTLQPLGMSGLLDDLELKLNRAAEEATPPARTLFLNAIEDMTLEDARAIYSGPPDAATRYFQDKMSAPLAEAMQPIIDKSLVEVGAIQTYDSVMQEYRTLPFVPDVKADLNQYVTDKAMDGIFHYLAEEEAAIRQNPVKRTTEILQKVFGAN